MSAKPEIQIIEYSPEYSGAFRELNKAWIERYFALEEEDIKVLDNPERIIEDGGFIFIALINSEAAGVCALRKASEDTYEFSKMAVAGYVQGKGVGRKLGEAALNKAALRGAKRVYLEGNTLLEASIHLYKKLGFKETSMRQAHYKRVNIIMEKLL